MLFIVLLYCLSVSANQGFKHAFSNRLNSFWCLNRTKEQKQKSSLIIVVQECHFWDRFAYSLGFHQNHRTRFSSLSECLFALHQQQSVSQKILLFSSLIWSVFNISKPEGSPNQYNLFKKKQTKKKTREEALKNLFFLFVHVYLPTKNTNKQTKTSWSVQNQEMALALSRSVSLALSKRSRQAEPLWRQK